MAQPVNFLAQFGRAVIRVQQLAQPDSYILKLDDNRRIKGGRSRYTRRRFRHHLPRKFINAQVMRLGLSRQPLIIRLSEAEFDRVR